MVVSTQPNVCRTHSATAVYAPSAQMTCSRGSRPRTRSSNVLAPSRSCTSAGSTTKPQISPSVSTRTCRLRPPIFFPRVVPLGAADLRGLDRLAVHHGGTGGRFAVVQLPQVDPEHAVDLLDQPGVAPGVEVVADQTPGREVVRQHAPGTAAAGQVEQGIHDVAQVVGAGPAALAALGPVEQVLDVVPLEVGEVAGIVLPCVHAPDANGAAARRQARFLDALLTILRTYSISTFK